MNTCSLNDARAAKNEALDLFRGLAPVIGVGITRIGEGYGLKVNLQREPAAGASVPEMIRKVPIQVEIVGAIVKR